jgi:transposase
MRVFAQAPLNGPVKTDPLCSRCGGATDLIRIEPAWRSYERRILECRECGKSDSYTS